MYSDFTQQIPFQELPKGLVTNAVDNGADGSWQYLNCNIDHKEGISVIRRKPFLQSIC